MGLRTQNQPPRALLAIAARHSQRLLRHREIKDFDHPKYFQRIGSSYVSWLLLQWLSIAFHSCSWCSMICNGVYWFVMDPDDSMVPNGSQRFIHAAFADKAPFRSQVANIDRAVDFKKTVLSQKYCVRRQWPQGHHSLHAVLRAGQVNVAHTPSLPTCKPLKSTALRFPVQPTVERQNHGESCGPSHRDHLWR